MIQLFDYLFLGSKSILEDSNAIELKDFEITNALFLGSEVPNMDHFTSLNIKHYTIDISMGMTQEKIRNIIDLINYCRQEGERIILYDMECRVHAPAAVLLYVVYLDKINKRPKQKWTTLRNKLKSKDPSITLDGSIANVHFGEISKYRNTLKI